MKALAVFQQGECNFIRYGIFETPKGKLWCFFVTEKYQRTPIGVGPFNTFEECHVGIQRKYLSPEVKQRIL